jgi:Protein of unknown function (DUF2806)
MPRYKISFERSYAKANERHLERLLIADANGQSAVDAALAAYDASPAALPEYDRAMKAAASARDAAIAASHAQMLADVNAIEAAIRRIGHERWEDPVTPLALATDLGFPDVVINEDMPDPLKELTKMTNLINKVSKALGVVYEPTRAKRIEVDAAARIITAKAPIELTDLQRRAAARWLHLEEHYQENLETISAAAISHLSAESKFEEIDDDWLASFFDHAKKVSDKDMQTLWAKILAGQINAPGTFRKSVLQTVSLLEKEDADLFVKLCQFEFDIAGFTPVIFDAEGEIYNKRGITFDTMSHLDDIGLITFNSIVAFSRIGMAEKFQISYGNEKYSVVMPEGVRDFEFGHVMLTTTGRQLAPLSNTPAIPEFPAYAIACWKARGIAVAKV